MTRKRCVMIGAGGHADEWIGQILPRFADRVEITALVDVSEHALAASRAYVGLQPERCFTNTSVAFDSVEADFCVISIPARFHADAAIDAARHGLPILCEKPLADTWAACKDMYGAVHSRGLKMEIVQNYRYSAPMRPRRSKTTSARPRRSSAPRRGASEAKRVA